VAKLSRKPLDSASRRHERERDGELLESPNDFDISVVSKELSANHRDGPAQS